MIVVLEFLVAWSVVLGGIRRLRATTLMTAWVWAFVAATAWTVTWLADQCARVMSPAVADHAWYACAVISLCPPIAVLGSRRPGTRVWSWFILFPMLLALCWPIAAIWLQGSELRRLQLESPQLVAFFLVLVMGVGNYCGTRFTLPALMYGGSIFTLVLSSSVDSPHWLKDLTVSRFWCTFVVTAAICFVKASTRPPMATKFDRLWFDFFDTFGIVWGRRIQDRVNFIVTKEGLPARLEFHGFVWSDKSDFVKASVGDDEGCDPSSPANYESTKPTMIAVETRVEHILRWLLRRFVDPAWIDERLGTDAGTKSGEFLADS